MTTEAARRVTLQSRLRGESLQRPPRLFNLYDAEPRSRPRKYRFDGTRSFNEPLEIVGLSVALDSPYPAEDALQPEQHLWGSSDFAMLGRRCPNAIPAGTPLARLGSDQSEAALRIQEAGCPRASKVVDGRICVGGILMPVMGPRGTSRSPGPENGLVLSSDYAHRMKRLLPLDRSEPRPQKGDRGLRFLESAGSPHMDAFLIRRIDTAHAENGALKAEQHRGDHSVAALRDTHLETEVTRSVFMDEGASFAVVETGRPCKFDRVDLRDRTGSNDAGVEHGLTVEHPFAGVKPLMRPIGRNGRGVRGGCSQANSPPQSVR